MKLSAPVRHVYTRTVPPGLRRWLERKLLGPYPNIFDRKQFVFVHIPKTAGQSVASLLHNRGSVHLSYREYETLVGPRLSDYFVFSIVREPLDRLRSAFAYLRAGGNQSQEDVAFAEKWIRGRTFSEFVLSELERKPVVTSLFFKPQCDFLVNHANDLAPILRLSFERLDQEFPAVAAHLDLASSLPRVNQRPDAHYIGGLGASAQTVVARVYRDDYARLGYRCPIPAA